MFALNRCARVLACVAAIGMVASPVMAATPAVVNPSSAPAVSAFDVKTQEGRLFGQVVKSTGAAEAGVEVALMSTKDVIAKTKTDELGRFAFPMTKSGMFRVAVGERSFVVRAWSPDVAPPKSKTGILCVTQDVVRGQCGGCGSLGPCGCGAPAPSCGIAGPSCGMAGPSCGAPCGPCGLGGGFGGLGGGGGLGAILTNPVVIGLGVAAAIAIPIALDDDDDDDGSSGTGGSGEPAS